jgi:pyridoxine 5-phosphate synthase
MLEIAIELAQEDRAYEDVAVKFFEHFTLIARAINDRGLWDEADGFYYDRVRRVSDGEAWPVRVRSMTGLIPLCAQARPAQATLVPDGDGQLTSDHGFDFARDSERLRPLIAELKALGCRVSLFVDAGNPDLARAADVGADRVELYTGPYAAAFDRGDAAAAAVFAAAARRAQAAGLGVNAGHDLAQANLGVFLAAVPRVLEVSIGHALIGEALYAGLDATVKAYLALLPSVR